MSFDRLGRFAVRRRWWIVGGVGACSSSRRCRSRRRRPGALGGRLHPRRPRVGAGQAAAPGRARRRALGVRPRLHLGRAHGRDARVAGRGHRRDPRRGRARRTSRGSCRTSSRRARSAPTATPRTTSCSSTSRPTTRPTRSRASRRSSTRRPGSASRSPAGPAFYGDVQAVTERDLQRSEVISLPLAALALLLVFGSLVAAGVPLAVGGASVLVALAGIFLVASVDPDEHLRAQPRDAPRPRAGRRLLAADDQPLPRGAGPPRRAGPGRRGRPGHGRHRRSRGVLLGPDRAARPAGPRAVRVHDPALGRASPGRSSSVLAVAAAITLLPAILAILGTRVDRLDGPLESPRSRRADGAWARLARRVMRHPVAVLVPDAHAAARPGAAVPPRPVQRAGRLDPPAGCPVARGVRRPGARVRRGRVRAARASRSGRPATRRPPTTSPRLYAYSRRLAADPRVSPGRVSLVDVDPRADPRPVPAPLRLARPARPTGSSRPRWARRRRAT